jgi:TonB family protein
MKPWLLISLAIHVVLLGVFFFFTKTPLSLDTRWSGGKGDGIAYIDLSISSSPKISGVKTKGVKQQVKKQKQKTARKKQALNHGVGDSNTPAGGKGSGLDKGGKVSTSAPSLLAKIRKKIARNKRYPRIAKEKNIAGKVKLGFKITEEGALEYVKVVKSSGSDLLDKAAVSAVRKAEPLPYYPHAIVLALEYRLEE